MKHLVKRLLPYQVRHRARVVIRRMRHLAQILRDQVRHRARVATYRVRLRAQILCDHVRHHVRTLWASFVQSELVHPARRRALAAELSHLLHVFRGRYGQDFRSAVARQDEMYRSSIDSFGWRWRRREVLLGYFQQGEKILANLEACLEAVGRPMRGMNSALEFACGYGRLARFLRERVGPSRLTVSDIDTAAVDFVTRQFGVRGFYSTREAGELAHDGRYDLIVVVSLFSHLAIEHWGPWLRRLTSLLNDGGLLVFTTHGPDLIGGLHPALKRRLEAPGENFVYLQANETYGRLATAYYGSTYVSEAYVRDQVQSHGLGRLAGFFPRRLLGFQDVYVVERSTAAVAGSQPEQSAVTQPRPPADPARPTAASPPGPARSAPPSGH